MSKFNFIKADIRCLHNRAKAVYKDNRGYFLETYNKSRFQKLVLILTLFK